MNGPQYLSYKTKFSLDIHPTEQTLKDINRNNKCTIQTTTVSTKTPRHVLHLITGSKKDIRKQNYVYGKDDVSSKLADICKEEIIIHLSHTINGYFQLQTYP